mmetsp:Transcript_30628/g.84192  ORF Transcript_30628/g.84192 Transcript_30628/m.84192 type:complete len:326 (+) Transcript_30628:2-979(+)
MRAQYVLGNFSLLQQGTDSSEGSADDTGGKDSESRQQHSELKNIETIVDRWIGALPALSDMPVVSKELTSSATVSPLARCVAREVVKGTDTLALVLEDLKDLSEYSKGNVKATNLLRDLVASIRKGTVPSRWRQLYATSKALNLSDWVANLVKRAKVHKDRYSQLLTDVNASGDSLLSTCDFWIGGMFTPEAFITATRQYTAQVNQWSLEDVELTIEIGASTGTSQDTGVDGVMLEGAKWNDDTKALELSEILRSSLPRCVLRWTHKSDRQQKSSAELEKYVHLPLYLHEERTVTVAEVLLYVDSPIPSHVWAQRGAALILQSTI